MKIITNKFNELLKISPTYLILVILTIAFSIISVSFILFILLFSLSEIFILFCHYFYQLIFVPMMLNLSVAIIFMSNPIYSLLVLICIFLYSAFLLLSLHIQFIALIYIIIYIGAIAILFLFVLMMFNLKQLTHKYSFYSKNIDLYVFVGALLLFYLKIKTEFMNFNNVDTSISNVIWHKAFNVKYYVNFIYSDILIFGNLLYTYHSFIFLYSGLLLFIAMIGALVLALSVTEQTLLPHENKAIRFRDKDQWFEKSKWLEWPKIEGIAALIFGFIYIIKFWGHESTTKPKMDIPIKEIADVAQLLSS